MNFFESKLLKPFIILVLVFLFVGIATQIHKKNSVTLDQYAKDHPEQSAHSTDTNSSSDTPTESGSANDKSGESETSDDKPATGGGTVHESEDDNSENNVDDNNNDADANSSAPVSVLTGALLNGGVDGQAMSAERVTYNAAPDTIDTPAFDADTAAFYYEPLSENLQRYITGVSYPAVDADSDTNLAVGYSDLRYLHILHYDFEGNVAEGELICNAAIAEDLLDIFFELYRNEYRLERVHLIDEYDGDDTASMEDNNTSCFNYRVVDGTTHLSKHALGLALDINPLYNPYVTYEKDGSLYISPSEGAAYVDRSAQFPYKIDENDLCYKLFIKHGFTWGGNWNSLKDYQHFQKAIP